MTHPRRALIAGLATLGLVLSAPAVIVGAVHAHAASAPAPRPVLFLPVEGGRIVRVATLPDQPWLTGHRGIDVRAEVGAAVLAPGAGTVAFVGRVAGRNVVTIALDVGVTATLEPVTGTVEPGTRVRRGDPVGTVEALEGHCAPRTCVHWGIRHGKDYMDPLDWLVGFGPIVLLPLE